MNGARQAVPVVPTAGNWTDYSHVGYSSPTNLVLNSGFQAGQNEVILRVQSAVPFQGLLVSSTASVTCRANPPQVMGVPTLNGGALALLSVGLAGAGWSARRRRNGVRRSA